jgi:tetratricopeptide (TPR) repeat protein
MKVLAWMLILCVSMVAHAQESSAELIGASSNKLFKKAVEYYSEGKYQSTVDELKIVESQNLNNKQVLGLSSYWKGICYNRLQEFNEAVKSFDQALQYDYSPADLNYEYGQALYALDKLPEARIQFRESLKKKFKRGVSLYYIGFISKEMGEKNKAYTFLKSINKLDEAEAKEVKQAAEMQIGDIYLEQVEKRADAFKSVDTYVIPQYQKALELDKTSPLAPIIQEKIVKLQRKYDLVLFQLRNGRPTLIPPYFIRLAQEFGMDSNVLFSPAQTTVSKSKQSSPYSTSSFIGRYTFYLQDYFSISPELRFINTYYFHRVKEIYVNDNQLIAPALRTAYEHTMFKRPASFLVDYDYNEARRDVHAKQQLEFNSRSHTFMVGERFQWFTTGESTVRLRMRKLDSYLASSDSKLTSFVFEHIKPFGIHTFLFYGSYDMMRVDNDAFNTNAFTLRGDIIFARFRDWFTPSFGLMMTSTDPINDRSARGRELMINPSARLSKTFKKSWRANLKYDYQKNNSKNEEAFAYKKQIFGFELEYLF